MNIEYYTVKEINNESNIIERNYEKFYEAAKQYGKLVEFGTCDVHLTHEVITDNGSMTFPVASYWANTKKEIISI